MAKKRWQLAQSGFPGEGIPELERPQVGRQTGKVEKGLWWRPARQGPQAAEGFLDCVGCASWAGTEVAALLLQLGSGPVSPYSVTTN